MYPCFTHRMPQTEYPNQSYYNYNNDIGKYQQSVIYDSKNDRVQVYLLDTSTGETFARVNFGGGNKWIYQTNVDDLKRVYNDK